MHKLDYLRQRADHYLELARKASEPRLVEKYLSLAGKYERMARDRQFGDAPAGD